MNWHEALAKCALMTLFVIAIGTILKTIGFPSGSTARSALAGAVGVALGEMFFNYRIATKRK